LSLVVADTTPINYLVLCEAINVLQTLYGELVIPSPVFRELNHERTPTVVRSWVNSLPRWAAVKAPTATSAHHPNLGLGEREAIVLANELKAAHVLIDERLAREIAIQSGLSVTGTVGVLEEAAYQNLLDPRSVFDKLRRTNFRFEERMLEAVLARIAARKSD
jgi:predicted nucleic acid-binding protein